MMALNSGASYGDVIRMIDSIKVWFEFSSLHQLNRRIMIDIWLCVHIIYWRNVWGLSDKKWSGGFLLDHKLEEPEPWD